MFCQVSRTVVPPPAGEDSVRLNVAPPPSSRTGYRQVVALLGFAATLFLACGRSTAAPEQRADDRLQPRLVVAEQLLGGGLLDEGRVLDLKAQIEGLPFVVHGDRKPAREANTRGLRYVEAGEYDQAASEFERGLALDPADVEICNNLAFAYFRASRMAPAWQAIRKTLALSPARTSAWANIGQMRAAEGDRAASAWSFENSYRFSRKPASTLAYLGKLKAETDDAVLQQALSSALANIGSGNVGNLAERPRPVGGSVSGVAEHASADDELFGVYARVRAGDTAAFETIQTAANQGRRMAQAMLGEAYRRGYAVVEDPVLSFNWYRRAAEQGDSLAQFQLGLAYQDGRGVEQDYQAAAHWYAQAAALGDRDAMNNLGALYSRGQTGKADPALAAKLYRQASDLGNSKASYNLAIAYAQGDGVPRDLAESARLYRLSAEGGFAQAQLEVADNYENGRGVARDEAEALRWYRKAAEAGIDHAREVLKRKGFAN